MGVAGMARWRGRVVVPTHTKHTHHTPTRRKPPHMRQPPACARVCVCVCVCARAQTTHPNPCHPWRQQAAAVRWQQCTPSAPPAHQLGVAAAPRLARRRRWRWRWQLPVAPLPTTERHAGKASRVVCGAPCAWCPVHPAPSPSCRPPHRAHRRPTQHPGWHHSHPRAAPVPPVPLPPSASVPLPPVLGAPCHGPCVGVPPHAPGFVGRPRAGCGVRVCVRGVVVGPVGAARRGPRGSRCATAAW